MRPDGRKLLFPMHGDVRPTIVDKRAYPVKIRENPQFRQPNRQNIFVQEMGYSTVFHLRGATE
jgi:hypothetical protein